MTIGAGAPIKGETIPGLAIEHEMVAAKNKTICEENDVYLIFLNKFSFDY